MEKIRTCKTPVILGGMIKYKGITEDYVIFEKKNPLIQWQTSK